MGEKKPPPPVGHHDSVSRPLEVLRAVLARKFGSVYTGWWRGIDVQRSGAVPLADFSQALLAIGYPVSMKLLWRALNREPSTQNRKDCITLKEIDAETATAVDTFSSLVDASCGSFTEAWHTRLDTDKIGYVEETTFYKLCEEIQYPGNAKALFKQFNPIPNRFYAFFEDFGPLALSPGPARSPSRNREPEAWWRKEESERPKSRGSPKPNSKPPQTAQATPKPKEKNPPPPPGMTRDATLDLRGDTQGGDATPPRLLQGVLESNDQTAAAQFEPQPTEPATLSELEVTQPPVVEEPAKQPPSVAEDPVLTSDAAATPEAPEANQQMEAAVAAETEQLVNSEP